LTWFCITALPRTKKCDIYFKGGICNISAAGKNTAIKLLELRRGEEGKDSGTRQKYNNHGGKIWQ